MEINIFSIIVTIINIALLTVIVIGLFKGIKGIKSFINRNKVDIILSKLDNKDDK